MHRALEYNGAEAVAPSKEVLGGIELRPRTHVLTVAIEDYFQAGPFRKWIPHETWYRFEQRLAASTERALDLLDCHGVRATFFMPGYLADTMPDLVREVARRGHEIGSSGYSHRDVWEVGAETFRAEAERARDRLEDVGRQRVAGFRMPDRWLSPQDLWVFGVLAEAGYLYDSSIRPTMHHFGNRSWRDALLELGSEGRTFYEVPVSSVNLFGLQVPIGGGGGLRHYPRKWMHRAVSSWDQGNPAPYVMYFRTWELDPEQPRISIAPLSARVRQYRNLDRMTARLEEYLSSYRFTSVADYIGISTALPARVQTTAAPSPPAIAVTPRATAPDPVREAITAATIVIPCYNETQSLPYLRNTLQSVTESCPHTFAFHFVFVDDCSTDGTWAMLQALFGSNPRCLLVRHEQNRGIAGTIQTGIQHARTDVVCSIDCDCTYDPHELVRMIPLLSEGVDVVTASPYHPAGHVRNVPQWRLFLSKSLSRMYRVVLHQQLHTYTSCFRVYRKETATALEIHRPGFLGIAEMIGKLDLAGFRVVEYPTTLESRILGRSKMKVARTILGHVGLLADLTRLRWFGGADSTPAKASS